MVCFASTSRRAITWRILGFGTSVCGAVLAIGAVGRGATGAVAGATAGADAAAEGAAAAGLAPLIAASISTLTIRPFGPLPASAARSIPACNAIRRATGETKIRSPTVSCPLPFAATGAAWVEPDGAGAAAAAGAAGGAAVGAAAGAGAAAG